MKKKIIYIIFLIYFMIPIVYAEGDTIFSVKTIKASPGQEVTLNVSMNNNPSFELLSYEIPLNSAEVEFISCDINGFDKAMMKSCGINPNNEIIFYALTMYTDEKKLLKDTGTIATIKLKILDKVKNDIPLKMKVTSFGKSDSESFPFIVENGYIRISGDIETKIINDKEDLSSEVNKKDVTWNTSDGEVASVDPNGNVEFNSSGNATISAVDKDGKIIYEKTYLVNNIKKKKLSKLIFPIGIAVVIILIPIILILRKIKIKGKKNETK